MEKRINIKIFIITGGVTDCCVLQRLRFPLEGLNKLGLVNVSYHLEPYIDALLSNKSLLIQFCEDTDIIYFQRQGVTTRSTFEFIEFIKNNTNIKLIHEIDDYLLPGVIQPPLRNFYESCTNIISTEYLKNAILEKIPTAKCLVYPTKFPWEFNFDNIPYNNDICFVGTSGHKESFSYFYDTVLAELPYRCGTLITFEPESQKWKDDIERDKSYIIPSVSNYLYYLKILRTTPFKLGVVFVQENNYFSSKSPVKAYEYTFAGRIALFSNTVVYNQIFKEIPELLVENNAQSWKNSIKYIQNLTDSAYIDLFNKQFHVILDTQIMTKQSLLDYHNILTGIINE